MRWHRVQAILVKESLQIVRDPRSLMIALLIPLLQMFLLGYGISLDVKHIPMCTYDPEGSQASQNLLHRFTASPYFSMQGRVGSYAELGRSLDTGRCRLGIVIPAGFSKGLSDTGEGIVQAVIDGTDSNTANLAANYARALVANYSADVQLEAILQRGGHVQTLTPVEVRARVWFNEDVVSRNFIVPGIVALVMVIVGFGVQLSHFKHAGGAAVVDLSESITLFSGHY